MDVKRSNHAREKAFEQELAHICAVYHCFYIKIPDVVVTTKKLEDTKNYLQTENKRPFDGVLSTPAGNFCVECKYNSNTLLTHQKENLERISAINGDAYVLRKKEKFDKTGYRRTSLAYLIEKGGEVLFETGDIRELIKKFMVREGVA